MNSIAQLNDPIDIVQRLQNDGAAALIDKNQLSYDSKYIRMINYWRDKAEQNRAIIYKLKEARLLLLDSMQEVGETAPERLAEFDAAIKEYEFYLKIAVDAIEHEIVKSTEKTKKLKAQQLIISKRNAEQSRIEKAAAFVQRKNFLSEIGNVTASIVSQEKAKLVFEAKLEKLRGKIRNSKLNEQTRKAAEDEGIELKAKYDLLCNEIDVNKQKLEEFKAASPDSFIYQVESELRQIRQRLEDIQTPSNLIEMNQSKSGINKTNYEKLLEKELELSEELKKLRGYKQQKLAS
jgi:hypothetical protein